MNVAVAQRRAIGATDLDPGPRGAGDLDLLDYDLRALETHAHAPRRLRRAGHAEAGETRATDPAQADQSKSKMKKTDSGLHPLIHPQNAG